MGQYSVQIKAPNGSLLNANQHGGLIAAGADRNARSDSTAGANDYTVTHGLSERIRRTASDVRWSLIQSVCQSFAIPAFWLIGGKLKRRQSVELAAFYLVAGGWI